jgi:muconate cycloisomerase
MEAIAVDLPMLRPMKMAGVEIGVAENVLVKMVSDQGVVGWGEAASAPTMTGETVASITTAIRLLAAELVGAELDLATLQARMRRRLYGNSSAKAAIDMAAHDLVGRSMQKPVHELLGTLLRRSVPVLWLLGTGSEEADVLEARAKYADGFRAFKVKVGTAAVEADIRRTLAIRQALPADALVCADANQAWNVDDALRFVMGAGSSLAFLEQPVDGEDIAGMASVAAAGKTAIACDEGLHSMADLQHHLAASAASGGSLKAIKLGGLSTVLKAGQWCASHDWKVNLACKIAESGIATAAVLQLGAVLPTIDWGVSLSSQYLAEDIVRAPLRIINGRAPVPSWPGLGVEVDETRVRHYQRQDERQV